MLFSIAGLVTFSTIGIANAYHHPGKEVKYSGTIEFSTKSESVTAISENHLFVVREYPGTSTNSNGTGFLHNSGGGGYCTVTDQDEDKITGKFICIGTLPSCDWEQRLDVSGTRKYEGIKP